MTSKSQLAKQEQLFKTCKNFIKEQRISCGETIYQTDRVIENAQEFIHEICEIVGYAKIDDWY